MIATVIAVVGTLLGAVVTGLLQQRAARAERTEARNDARRSEQKGAIAALSVATTDHRRTMFMYRDGRLTGQDDERLAELRAEAHRTRLAIADPLVCLQLLVDDPFVLDAADRAVQATYDMRQAADADELQQLRREALAAHKRMVAAARAYLQSA